VTNQVLRVSSRRPAMEMLKNPTAAAVGLALVAVLAAFLIPKLVRPRNCPLGGRIQPLTDLHTGVLCDECY